MTDRPVASCFAQSYTAARALFLHACAEAGAEVTSHRHPLAGPAGEPLFLDEARIGAADARRVLFVASGTHGIEGFCGSGIQTALLRDGLAARLPPDVACVLVHAVNPWGFAWLRRVNEDNVDVNRNFMAPGAPRPENTDYDRLYDALNPPAIDPATIAAAVARVREFEQAEGPAAAYRALSGGQYRHPRGVQYGGAVPVWSNRVLRRVWARHADAAELAAHVDLHSGLGPRGTGLLFQTAPADGRDAALAAAWWPDVIRADPATGTEAALASGLIGPAFSAAHPPGVGVVLEFGTLPGPTVMLAVVADNWLAQHGERDSAEGTAVMQQMRDAFFLADDEWQEAVCRRSSEVIAAALAGLAGASDPTPAAVRVRAARVDDLETLVAFSVAMARETEDHALPPATVTAGLAALLRDPARGRAFVVDDGGRVVAALVLTPEWSDWRNGFFWWIQNVYVDPAHRRRGLYRRLHDHVRAQAAADPGVCGLRLYVERDNQAARRTYEALGMAETAYRLYEEPTRIG